LSLLNLALVSDPGVEDSLGLGGKGSLLLELESLGLELGGFLLKEYMSNSGSTHNAKACC